MIFLFFFFLLQLRKALTNAKLISSEIEPATIFIAWLIYKFMLQIKCLVDLMGYLYIS